MLGLFRPNIEKLKEKRDIEKLVKALHHKDPVIRRKAAEALGTLRDKKAIKPLVEALKDEEWEVRWEAAKALKNIGFKEATKSFVGVLGEALKKSGHIRDEAESLLKSFKGDEVQLIKKLRGKLQS
jgi:HEAT repeat protein